MQIKCKLVEIAVNYQLKRLFLDRLYLRDNNIMLLHTEEEESYALKSNSTVRLVSNYRKL